MKSICATCCAEGRPEGLQQLTNVGDGRRVAFVSDIREEQGFDELLARLKTVVAKLEQGNLSLEESLKAYEEGVALARRGHTLLDSAEKRVEVLVEKHGGESEVAPLEGDWDEADDDGSDS